MLAADCLLCCPYTLLQHLTFSLLAVLLWCRLCTTDPPELTITVWQTGNVLHWQQTSLMVGIGYGVANVAATFLPLPLSSSLPLIQTDGGVVVCCGPQAGIMAMRKMPYLPSQPTLATGQSNPKT